MGNLEIGTRIIVHKPGSPFHGKKGIITEISRQDKNRFICRFQKDIFSYGFYQNELKIAV